MQTSKQIVKDAGIHPKLKLLIKKEGVNPDTGKAYAPTPTGEHKIRLLKDKEITKKDVETGKDVPYIRYLVEEHGEIKIYDTRKYSKDTGEVSYLVQKLAEYPENSYVILEAKKQGTKNYISVKPVNTVEDIEVDDEESEEDAEFELPEVKVDLDDDGSAGIPSL